MSFEQTEAVMDRRRALEWMLRVSALVSVGSFEFQSHAQTVGAAMTGATGGSQVAGMGRGYGPDPNMVRMYQPGEVWPLTLVELERKTLKALCDEIIPADGESPSASQVGVVEFLDEWVSAPYPDQQRDRVLLIEGLGWLEAEARRLHDDDFSSLGAELRGTICGRFANPAEAKGIAPRANAFFKRLRDLTMGAYYTTPEGMKAAGYVGNVPVMTFEGPPPEALRHVGLI